MPGARRRSMPRADAAGAFRPFAGRQGSLSRASREATVRHAESSECL